MGLEGRADARRADSAPETRICGSCITSGSTSKQNRAVGERPKSLSDAICWDHRSWVGIGQIAAMLGHCRGCTGSSDMLARTPPASLVAPGHRVEPRDVLAAPDDEAVLVHVEAAVVQKDVLACAQPEATRPIKPAGNSKTHTARALVCNTTSTKTRSHPMVMHAGHCDRPQMHGANSRAKGPWDRR